MEPSRAVRAFREDEIMANFARTFPRADWHELHWAAIKRVLARRVRDMGLCTTCSKPLEIGCLTGMNADSIGVYFACMEHRITPDGERSLEVAGPRIDVHDIAVEMGYPDRPPRIDWKFENDVALRTPCNPGPAGKPGTVGIDYIPTVT